MLALAAVGLVALPSRVWKHPQTDFVASGLDRNLAYVSGEKPGDGGRFDGGALELLAAPKSTTTSNFVTTPLERFNVSTKVKVVGGSDTTFRLGIWSPWTQAGYFLLFNGKSHRVTTQVIEGGDVGSILLHGQVVATRALGAYDPSVSYRIELKVLKDSQITMAVNGEDLQVEDRLQSADLEPLRRSSKLSVTASVEGADRPGEAMMTDYFLTLPHQAVWVDKVDDWRARFGVLAIVIGSFMVLAGAYAARSLRRSSWYPLGSVRLRPLEAKGGRSKSSHGRRWLGLVAMLVGVYLVGNFALFGLGGHPFDMVNEKAFAYVANQYGVEALYFLPNMVSFPAIWHGVPMIEAAFPYEPVFAYLFGAIGWVYSTLMLGGRTVDLGSSGLEYLIKAVNVMFGLADGFLIYKILTGLQLTRLWSAVGSILFMFNPAAWFSMSVWGQTHVISVFFVLLTVWAAQRDWPFLAWLSLVAACLTRPQMLIFGLVIGVFLLRRFAVRRNITAISWATIATFVALAPLTLATSPSLPVDVMANNFRIQEAGGNDPALTTVSQDAYSIWPLVTYFRQGASGFYRSFTPSAQALVGSLTYQRVGLIATAMVLLAVIFVLLRRKRDGIMNGEYLPLVALGIVGFLMFMTGLVATHFLLALPFIILCRRWISSGAFFFIVIVWTTTTLVPMYGDMGNVIARLDYPLLSPLHNGVTRFFVELYSWDRFITFATLANIAVLIWIAVVALRPKSQPDLMEATT